LRQDDRPLSAAALRRQVERRAEERCEYCRAPQRACGYHFHVEHIIPVARGGEDGPTNRALACASCNLAKSDRMTGIDPLCGEAMPLFHPRLQRWEDHFRWADDRETLEGTTPVGRATIVTLDMNSELRRPARLLWFAVGLLP
jgi:hypothetical protein